MKKSLLNKGWLYNSKNEFIGVNLGFEFAAEHESGISAIRDQFGVTNESKGFFSSKPVFGLAARTMTKLPDWFGTFVEETGETKVYSIYSMPGTRHMMNDYITPYIEESKKFLQWPGRKKEIDDFIAYWDSRSFLIATTNEKYYNELKNAFENKDIAFYLGSKGFLNQGGFHMCIVSKTDKEVDEIMAEMDQDAFDLRRAADKTGIEKKLKKAGKDFYALSPRWKDDTSDEVVFWLNPVDQRSYEAGWYTIEELKQWIKGEGPIIKKKEETI